MADDLALQQPIGLDNQSWTAITSHRDRLSTATNGSDRGLILGRAKELAESVARIVITERGGVAAASTTFPKLIDEAHSSLQRQPGKDLSQDSELRGLVQGAMKIVRSVGEIRNSFGSGQGRVRDPEVEIEMVEVTVAATMLWVRWALRRLAPLILGQPTSLMNDLLHGGTFRRGQLAERLTAADIGNLDDPIQQKLGTCIARRAMQKTFLVREEGVEACAVSSSLTDWPPAYRRGLIDGLLFDDNGRVITSEWGLLQIPGILRPMSDVEAELRRLLPLLGTGPFVTGDWQTDRALFTKLKGLTNEFDEPAQAVWKTITTLFEPEPF